MFLQEPARHWVQFTVEPAAAQAGTKLSQLGEEGPIVLDPAILERMAFDKSREQFYSEQTVQKDPLKGNFANVARERSTGTLLGPTNHHGFQPALRALYESRFSRRMSFEDYRRNVEIVSDPALVERWKEEARTVTTIVTKDGDPPATLATVADARTHFRQHHFDALVQSGTTRKVHGSIAKDLPEAALMQAIRQAHETELRYPAHFVQLLREGLQNAGLHIFKHRKRVVYVSLSRPVPFAAGDSAVSPHVAAILDVIGKNPLCTRKFIAEHLLAKQAADAAPTAPAESADATRPVGEDATTPAADTSEVSAPKLEIALPAAPVEDPAAKAKAALASDLRFLVQAGHIIEFHNGTFDLPLSPKAKEEASAVTGSAEKPIAEVTSAEETTVDEATTSEASTEPTVLKNTDEGAAVETDFTAGNSVADEEPAAVPPSHPASTEQSASGEAESSPI